MVAARWGVEYKGRVFEFPSLTAAMNWSSSRKDILPLLLMGEFGEWVRFGAE